ncbi:MAG: SDR family oxidoreductase [Actinomycetota bacterium]
MTITPDSILLTDRVALVTGAAQGIGEATAVLLARFGCDLAICDREAEGLAQTATVIEGMGRRVVSGVFDVRDGEAVDGFMARVGADLGPIDVLVNNVGGGFHAPFSAVSPNGEAALVAENFGTVTNCVRSAMERFAPGAAIVNVTSVEAYHAAPGFGVYAAMKAAVEQFSKTLALELSDRGIRVNCVGPDMIPTPGDADLAGASGAMADDHHPTPLRRMGTPEECAAVIVFLASDLASFVTGVTIPVDGGTTAGAAWKVGLDGTFRM